MNSLKIPQEYQPLIELVVKETVYKVQIDQFDAVLNLLHAAKRLDIPMTEVIEGIEQLKALIKKYQKP